ncbi:MAG: hypothetical protein HUU49_01415 [Candidatus Buchananbacteria bacterium]|nr:hypothetical protein [Candidatus Buchananbacteria bacterium]
MFFRVNLATLEVERLNVRNLSEVPGVKSNGQHYQLEGFALVEVRTPSCEMLLFHPETQSSSGHIDVTYRPQRHDGAYGVDMQMYTHGCELDFANDHSFQYHWPSGQWHLLMAIDAIEQFLKQEIGYTPHLREYIGHTFRPTPPKLANLEPGESAAA